VRDSDLPVFWRQLGDERARHMAAVTRGYHYDRAAFDAHWGKVRFDPAVIVRTVLAEAAWRRTRTAVRGTGQAGMLTAPGARSQAP
jgi:hypothetical protein